jgi:preprotein translocase subunit SecY
VAENLKKSNCFIVGIRPGANTANYLDKIVVRLTFLGSIYLVVICVIPEIIVTQYSVPLTVGGTGILIMVNVVLDVMNQFRSYLYSDKYSSVQKGRRVRLRVR